MDNADFDIDKKLKDILSKYDMFIEVKWSRSEIFKAIKKILHEKCDGKKVGIRCGGVHTRRFLEDFRDEIDIACIIDRKVDQLSNSETEIKKYNIPIISDYKTSGVDICVISSFEYRKEVKQELEEQGCEEIVDIYDELEKVGYKFESGYYFYYVKYAPAYKRLLKCKEKYLNSRDTKAEKGNLLQLIKEYFYVRDIQGALHYIDVYIDHIDDGAGAMKNMKEEIIALQEEITRVLHEKKTKDIIWYWLDALPHAFVDKMPFVSSMKGKEGIFFENSYTCSFLTHEVLGWIFDGMGEREILESGYEFSGEHLNVKKWQSLGYQCTRMMGIGWPEGVDLNSYTYKKYSLGPQRSFSEDCWCALRELVRNDEPQLLLLHSFIEIHEPAIASILEAYPEGSWSVGWYVKEIYDQVSLRREKTILYYDKQLEWMNDMLGESAIRILMSDHALVTPDSHNYSRDLLHNALVIWGGQLSGKTYKNLFCIKQFPELICNLIQGREFDELFVPYFTGELVDVYSENMIRKCVKEGNANKVVAANFVMTLKDEYVLLATGEEIYQVYPDEKTNQINNPEFVQRINELKSIVCKVFIDINTNSHFKFSHRIYEAIGKKYLAQDIAGARMYGEE